MSTGRLNLYREGDFIQSVDGLVFDAKGFIHPPSRIVAYLRYYPDPAGNRIISDMRYTKVYDLDARRKLLAEKWPEYIIFDHVFNEEIQAVSRVKVEKKFDPLLRLAEIISTTPSDRIERASADLAYKLADLGGIPIGQIGVTGSILVGAHNNQSDLDLIVYGESYSRKLHERMSEVTEESGLVRYGEADLVRLYRQRCPSGIPSYDCFRRLESGKIFSGKFENHDYFIRCVKEWSEISERYGDRVYRPKSRLRIRGRISDGRDSIFTPCLYAIDEVENIHGDAEASPTEIVSFRGKYCEQLRAGERFLAEGKLESVADSSSSYYRLVLGSHPDDFLVLAGE